MRLHPNRGHSVRGASGIASLQLHGSQQQCTQAVGAQNPLNWVRTKGSLLGFYSKDRFTT
jgi:hypothetical protein